VAESRPTIADVAARAGVSLAAVSFALNSKPGVGEETRKRILEVAAELGWQPSARARSLSTKRALALGLVLARPPELLGADPFFPSFIAGVEAVLWQVGQSLVLQVVPDSGAEEAAYRRLAGESRVDGVFLADLRTADSRVRLLEDLGLPAVTLNRPDVPSPFPAVCLDDRFGVRAAVEHLAGLGHTRIAHVGGPQHLLHGASRRLAWHEALTGRGLDPSAFVETDFTAAAGAEATRALLGLAEPPTAVVYANDLMAVAGMSVAAERGLRLPDHLSVTGFDDIALAAHVHPALTTVHTDAFGWGEAAARVLLGLVDAGPAEDVELPPVELVVRRSTAPPRPRG
jgi:DNA-binding LacI/PurR family transcriptional regulator